MPRMFLPTAVFTLLSLLLALPEQSWALQSHGPPEGLYVHQIAHVLFMGALGYLYWHTRVTQEPGHRGWKYLQVFCVLMFLWNMVAFTGHEAFEHLLPGDFHAEGTLGEQLVEPLTSVKLLYFVTKLDHLLFVPALLALLVSLRGFYRQAREGR